MSKPQSRKIAIVGGTGSISSHTLSALLATNLHTLTATSRSNSGATFPSNAAIKKGDYTSHSFLVSALTGNEVLIMQLGIFSNDQQVPLIRAAAEAGVKDALPTEFGLDPYAPFAKSFPMLTGKVQDRKLVDKKASLYAGAEARFNTSTLHQVGRGVANLLSLPDAQLEMYKNSPVYLGSFCISQCDILDATIRAMGTKESDWNIETRSADEVIEEWRKAVMKGNHMAMIKEFYVTHWLEGAGGNYQEKATRDTKMLGLDEESFDEVLKAVVQELESAK